MFTKIINFFQKKDDQSFNLLKQIEYINSIPSITTKKPSTQEYNYNPIVYRCIKLIAESASHVPLIIMSPSDLNGKLIKNQEHYCNKILKRPNPVQGGAEFFTRIITNKLLYGESFVLMSKSPIENKKIELYLIENNSIEPIIQQGRVVKYVTSQAISKQKTIKVDYPIDQISNQSQILHLTNYNPLNPLRGLSCLMPATKAISLHNQAMEWNNMLLQNGARPSGALVVKDANRYLSQEEFQRLKNQLVEKYSSYKNTGRPLVLEGGLDWKEMSMSPKDMDFAESKDAAAREIALACGVPPQLLGIKGDNTYSNMQEARIALWEETIIPLLDNLTDALSSWLTYWLQEDITVDFDKDSISALTTRTDNRWSKISNVNFMTNNEK